jgi:FkbM family methyltransferase
VNPDALRALAAALISVQHRLPTADVAQWRTRLEQTERLDDGSGEILLSVTGPHEHVRASSCRKEPWTVRWIEASVKPGDVLYDVGANVGAYSLLAAHRTRGDVRVFAFEPAFATYATLCRNVVLNHFEDCITPLPFALGDAKQLGQLNYACLDAGAALHTVGAEVDYRGVPFQPVYRQPILVQSLDALVRELGLPVPQHLKIDVDGTELAVLRGAREALCHNAMKTLLIEICELRAPATEITGFLEERGWSLGERHDRRDGEGRTLDISYLLFFRKGGG